MSEPYVHPSAIIDAGASVGAGTRIWHFCHVGAGARIGARCTLGQNVFVAPGVTIGDGVKVQNNVSIYAGVVLEDDVFCGPSMVFTNVRVPRAAYPQAPSAYEVTRVCRGASIGANASVVCGVTIGRWALVGAGSVVTRDVPDHAVVRGVPARAVGWVCECGERLRVRQGSARCALCARGYERGEDGRLRAGEASAASAPLAASGPPAASAALAVGPARIPITRLEPGLRALAPAIEAALRRVLDSGVFIGGPEVQAFEHELASYLGVRACVGVNSGTDALVIALRALGVGAGDEVLVPAFGFIASAEAVSLVGAVPVFVDIEPRSFNVDPAALERARSSRTRGLVAVHLFGQAAPMLELAAYAAEHGLWVLEDVAQALGGRYRGAPLGSLGRAAALSFFPSKNLGACGDAGLIATDDLELAEAARALRQHGARRRYEHERLGQNSRLDALQAAILRTRLPNLDAAVAARRAAARRYAELLAGAPLELPFSGSDTEHTFHQYTVRLPEAHRDRVQAALHERGIESVVYYRTPLHQQPVYRGAERTPVLPHAEAASRSVLSLPIWPEISLAEQERVALVLRAAL